MRTYLKNKKRKYFLIFFFTVLMLTILSIVVKAGYPIYLKDNNRVETNYLYDVYAENDLFTGALNYRYDISVPHGTNNLQPNVFLRYNSYSKLQNPNSLASGWELSENYIQRDTNYTDDIISDDKFILFLDGEVHDLIYASSDGRYHTEIESFLNIQNESKGNNLKDKYWVIKNKDGINYRFGFSNDSNILSNLNNYSWRWYLDSIIDTHNNTIFYSYSNDPNENDNGAVYLNEISYNNDEKRKIQFLTEPQDRTDIRNFFYNGHNVTTSKRIKEIVVLADDELIRRYVLSYVDSTSSPAISFLANITLYGEDNISSLPGPKFDYFNYSSLGWTQDDNWEPPVCFRKIQSGNHDEGIRLADINGDGLVDVLEGLDTGSCGDGQKTAWINNGTGWVENDNWEPPVCFMDTPGEDDDLGVRLADVNGDGLIDVLKGFDAGSCGDAQKRAWINNGTGWVENDNWEPPTCFTNIVGENNDQGVVLADVNGDGLIDVLKGLDEGSCGDAQKRAWINNGTGWVENDNWEPPTCFTDTPGEDDDLGVRLADVNGDGLIDVLKGLGSSSCSDSQKTAWINNGTGWTQDDNWEPPVCFRKIQSGNHDEGIRLADINGDGLVDVLEGLDTGSCGDGQKTAWINNGTGWVENDNWEPPTCFTDTPGEDDDLGVRLADVNGDGLIDVLKGLGSSSCSDSQKTAWINNGPKANLLKKIGTEMGGAVYVDYKKSTDFDNTGDDNISDLGFNLWTVANITKDTGVQERNISFTSYDYKDGDYNYEIKNNEFRGFNNVVETKPDIHIINRSFHQSDSLKGRKYKEEILDENQNIFRINYNGWVASEVDSYFVNKLIFESESTKYSPETGIPYKIKNTTYEYDSYGNILSIINLGDINNTDDQKYEYFEYVYNDSSWIVNKIKKYTLYGSDNSTKSKETKYSYDGFDYGDSPAKGDLTSKEEWLNIGDNPITSYIYDSYGNIISEVDPNGNFINYTYGIRDNTFTYVNQLLNSEGHLENYNYDLGTGNLLWLTDSNSILTNYTYDAFGRIKKEIKPYDNEAYPTIEYEYEFDGNSPEKIKIMNRETSGELNTIDLYEFYDGVGNLVQSKKEAEGGLQIVEDYFYDGLFRLTNKSNPYFNSFESNYSDPNLTIKDVSFVYDPLDRIILTLNPDSTYKNITYSGWDYDVEDENGNVREYGLDAYGRITSVMDDFDFENSQWAGALYSYDAQDNIIQINKLRGLSFEVQYNFTYDSLGRRVSMVDPDLGNWEYEYDKKRNLISQKDNRDTSISFEYDGIDRLKRKNSSAEVIDYEYDLIINNTLSRVNSSYFETNYSYDNRLRKIGEIKRIGNETFELEWTYDSLNRTVSENLDGNIINYSYNEQGLDGINGILGDIEYNEFDKVLSRDYGNGLFTNFTYNDENSRLIGINTDNIQDLDYFYDSVGNIIGINDTINSIYRFMEYDSLDRLDYASREDNTNFANYDIDFSYDSTGRFINIIINGNNITYLYDINTTIHAPYKIEQQANALFIKSFELEYESNTDKIFSFEISSSEDLTGINWTLNTGEENISSSLETELNTGESIFNYIRYNYSSLDNYTAVLTVYNSEYSDTKGLDSEVNSMVEEELFYDPNGNLIQDSSFYYVYNNFNQLEMIRDSNISGEIIAEYYYDQDGDRIRKSAFDQDDYYLGNLIRVVNLTGFFDTIYYKHGETLIAKNKNEEPIFFYHPDHLGSNVLISDENGTIFEETGYFPFGNILLGGEDRYSFTGKELDDESGLEYYGSRYYSPYLRLFVEPDSVIPEIYKTQSLNRYSYVLNNPYKYVDPTGNLFQDFQFDWYDVSGIVKVPAYALEGFSEIGKEFYNQYKESPASVIIETTLDSTKIGSAYNLLELGVKESVYQSTKQNNAQIISESDLTQTRLDAARGISSLALGVSAGLTGSRELNFLNYIETTYQAVFEEGVIESIVTVTADSLNKLGDELEDD